MLGKVFGNSPHPASDVTQERIPTGLLTSGPMKSRLSGLPHLAHLKTHRGVSHSLQGDTRLLQRAEEEEEEEEGIQMHE